MPGLNMSQLVSITTSLTKVKGSIDSNYFLYLLLLVLKRSNPKLGGSKSKFFAQVSGVQESNTGQSVPFCLYRYYYREISKRGRIIFL